MLYYGPVDSHGDGRNAIARKMLGQLEKRMAVTGQTFGKWSRVLSDGTLVTVWITKAGTHPQYRAKIVTPQRQESQSRPAVFMESGFMDGTGGINFTAEMYYTAEQQADLAVLSGGPGLSWLDWLDGVGGTLTSTSRVYIAGMPSLSMNTDERMGQYSGLFNYSTHSGKALLLWQAQAGTRPVPKSDYNGATLPQ